MQASLAFRTYYDVGHRKYTSIKRNQQTFSTFLSDVGAILDGC